jgi:hypothetical protein
VLWKIEHLVIIMVQFWNLKKGRSYIKGRTTIYYSGGWIGCRWAKEFEIMGVSSRTTTLCPLYVSHIAVSTIPVLRVGVNAFVLKLHYSLIPFRRSSQ